MFDFTQEKTLFEPDYKIIKDIKFGLNCWNEPKIGYSDSKGRIVFDSFFDSGLEFRNNHALVMSYDKSGKISTALINKKGGFVFEFGKYASNSGVRHGLVVIRDKNKSGYVNLIGEYVTDIKYDVVKHNDRDFGQVGIGGSRKNVHNGEEYNEFIGLWGLIDKFGQEITEIKYNDISYFKNGVCAVKIGEYWGFVDYQGNEITDFKYKYAVGNYYRINKDGGFDGIINTHGKEITQANTRS